MLFREPNINTAQITVTASVRPEESAPLVSRATNLNGCMRIEVEQTTST